MEPAAQNRAEDGEEWSVASYVQPERQGPSRVK